MCGILGELVLKGTISKKSQFLDILKKSEIRGPDHTDYYTHGNYLQFGFNRLSIIDLSSKSNQPIESHCKRYVMVYNGEVYNYSHIKRLLLKNGINFKSTGDSEVVVEAFATFGVEKTIKILDGMYAIGLFDKRKKRLHLIRDFAGIKPLFYGYDGKKVVFASQYDQVVGHPFFKDNPINLHVLKLYLSQHFIPPPYALIKNTHQVMPGEVVTFNFNGSVNNKRYWSLPNCDSFLINNEENALEQIDSSLNDSVKKELISDVPVGAFLSGGVDSPLICYYAQKNKKENLKTLNISTDSFVHDESSIANHVAMSIGANHEVTKIDGKFASNLLDDIISSIKEPFADISLIPTFIASKIIKRDATVVLSGDGGDELFFGYERFLSILKNINIQFYPYFLKYGLYGLDKIFTSNKNFNSACLFESQGDAHFNLNSRFAEKIIKALNPDLINVDIPHNYKNYNYENSKSELKLLQNMRCAEFYGMMQKTLRKVDLASMANSVEIRVPFLKKTFIKDSLKINPSLNFKKNGSSNFDKKWLLKKILSEKIPSLPLNTEKKGFSVPLQKWIAEDLIDHFSQVLLDVNSINYFGMNAKEITKLLEEHKNYNFDHKWPIFTIFSIFSWKSNL